MNPTFTILTLSYNKPRYIGDAIESVLAQTFTDFEYITVDNSIEKYFITDETGIESLAEDNCKVRCVDKILSYKDPRISFFEEPSMRDSKVAPKDKSGNCAYSAFLVNKYYEIAKGKYLLFLADDDVLYPECLARHLEFHQGNLVKASYHKQRVLDYTNAKDVGIRGKTGLIYDGTNIDPDCAIDGGCVVFERECLESIEKPWLPLGVATAAHCDGVFLSKLCKKFPLHPLDEVLSIHRALPLSCYGRFKKGVNEGCPKLSQVE